MDLKTREELGGTRGERGRGGGHHRHLRSAPNSPQSPEPRMERARAHREPRLCRANGCVRINGKAGAMGERQRGHLHLQRAVIFLVALTMQPQVSHRLSAISGCPLKPPPTGLYLFMCLVTYLRVFPPTAPKHPEKSRQAPSLPSLCCSLFCSCMALRPPVVSTPCSLLSNATQSCSNPVLDAWNANITAKTFGKHDLALKRGHSFV